MSMCLPLPSVGLVPYASLCDVGFCSAARDARLMVRRVWYVKLDLLSVSIMNRLLDSLEVEVDEDTDELDIGKEGGRFKL